MKTIRLSPLLSLPFLTSSFQFPSFPNPFQNINAATSKTRTSPLLKSKKARLLKEISNTDNGKSADEETQFRVLSIVRDIELNHPPPQNLLEDPEALQALDGVWYLQYTSPSVVGDKDQFPDAWKSTVSEPKIETQQINSKGSISARGLTVDISNRVTKQIFDVVAGTVYNEVEQDFGLVRVGGKFRPSPSVPLRGLVAFRDAGITLQNGFVISFGWVFKVSSLIRGTEDSGWLETTYLGEDMRIGRGNKGTMFVLTRDPNMVEA